MTRIYRLLLTLILAICFMTISHQAMYKPIRYDLILPANPH